MQSAVDPASSAGTGNVPIPPEVEALLGRPMRITPALRNYINTVMNSVQIPRNQAKKAIPPQDYPPPPDIAQ